MVAKRWLQIWISHAVSVFVFPNHQRIQFVHAGRIYHTGVHHIHIVSTLRVNGIIERRVWKQIGVFALAISFRVDTRIRRYAQMFQAKPQLNVQSFPIHVVAGIKRIVLFTVVIDVLIRTKFLQHIVLILFGQQIRVARPTCKRCT